MKKNQSILLVAIILLAIAAYFIVTKRNGTIREELKDFAIADTASVTKIFIADKLGHSVSVERVSAGKWTVNGKNLARQEAINTLLYTMKSVEIRSPVAKAAYNNIMKELAAKARKVEIYQNGKLSKTYFVGSATMDQLGTFMYLQNSSVPFVTHIPGFDGYLTTRYIVTEEEWLEHQVMDISIEKISSVISQDMEQPENSIMITRQPSGDFLLSDYLEKKRVEGAEQSKIQNYMAGFTNLNYENESRGKKEYIDSIKASGPFRILSVTDVSNKTTTIKMYHMAASEKSKQMFDNHDGQQLKYDPDRFFAEINGKPGLVVLQFYVYGKFFKKPSDFLVTSTKNKK
jgi:hypothetical protein